MFKARRAMYIQMYNAIIRQLAAVSGSFSVSEQLIDIFDVSNHTVHSGVAIRRND